MPFSLSSSALNDYQRYLSLLVGNAAYVDTPPLTVDYLVVAGGAGGGQNQAGGGGAGGLRSTITNTGGGGSLESQLTLAVSTNYTVTVGAGGAGGTVEQGSDGSSSVFSTISAVGGGGGGGYTTPGGTSSGRNGGSGGGGGAGADSKTHPGGSGTANQGFDGGDSPGSSGNHRAGGGGGAGQAGLDGSGTSPNYVGGDGGDGVQVSITGTSIYYAGGGGGAVESLSSTPGAGGLGGGGNGGQNVNTPTAGTTNLGGGGGGGANDMDGAAGGSGVVVIKYPITYDMTVGPGLGYKTVMYGDYKITEFTAGTGTVSFALAPTVVGSGEDILQEIVLEESASSVTFANLDQYASTYEHLEIRMTTRSTQNSTNQNLIYAYLNADTGSNYAWHRLYGNGSTVTSSAGASASQARIGFTPTNGASSTADGFAATVLTVLDPFNSSKNTTLRSLNGSATNDEAILLFSSLWNNTAALTSIEIKPASDSWITGSRFTLIGVK